MFIYVRRKVVLQEIATQGNPLAITVYSISTRGLFNLLMNMKFNMKSTIIVAFAGVIAQVEESKEMVEVIV